MKLTAENEGVLLDPVYTSKAMSALIASVKYDQLVDPTELVFLHTGGSPALHPYAKLLQS